VIDTELKEFFMPIPLLVWAAAAIAGSLFVAIKYGDKIQAYFESEEGQNLLGELAKVQEGHDAPYKKICSDFKTMIPEERREYLRVLKEEKMTRSNWLDLVLYARRIAAEDRSYFGVKADIDYIDNQD
jgi:hypothetical protein